MTEATVPSRRRAQISSRGLIRGAKKAGALVLVLGALMALWEGYKAFGTWADGTWPGTSVELPVPTDNISLPHSYNIIAELFDPVTRRADESLLVFLAKASWFTLKEAIMGFVLGAIVGLGLAVVMLRSGWLRRALMPWINISQTIPLIALAPLVVGWASGSFISETQSVAIIAALLSFFPIAVNATAGLMSAAEQDLELMRSYAAPWSQILWKVRVPAARPHLFVGFRLAGAVSVSGAIVAEISSGVNGGIGRAVLDYAGKYTTGPEKLYTAVLAAACLGLFVFYSLLLVERLLSRGQSAGTA